MRVLKFSSINIKPSTFLFGILIVLLFKPHNCVVKYVLCPDGKSACPNGNVCCSKGSGYRCCPEDLVCCRDGTYCCSADFLNEKRVVASLNILIPSEFQKDLSKEERVIESSNSSLEMINSNNDNINNNINNEDKCVEYIKKAVVIPIRNILERQNDFFSLVDMRLSNFLADLDSNCKDDIKDLKRSFINDIKEKFTLKNLLDNKNWKNLKEDLKFFLYILEKNIFPTDDAI